MHTIVSLFTLMITSVAMITMTGGRSLPFHGSCKEELKALMNVLVQYGLAQPLNQVIGQNKERYQFLKIFVLTNS